MRLKNPGQIIFAFVILAVVFFMYSDEITTYISTLNPILILIFTTLMSPAYLLLLYFLYKDYGWRGTFGGLLIVTASDLISIPHIILKTGQISKASYSLFADTLFFNILPFKDGIINLPIVGIVSLDVFLVYVIVSTLLVIAALMIVHKKGFKNIFWRSI